MPVMPNGTRAADVPRRGVVRAVQVPSARRVAQAQATVAAQAVLAEPVAGSVHRPAHRAGARLLERLAHVHVRVAAALEGGSKLGRIPEG